MERGYRDDLAYIHDAGFGHIAREAADRLVGELGRAGHANGTVVDVGCGSGILTRRLLDAGYRVVGIDFSDAMVALARTRAPEAELAVGSFVSVDLPECVAVAAVGEVLNYEFDPTNGEEARLDFFRRVHAALRPRGIVLFDVAGPARARPGLHRTFRDGPDWTVVVETERREHAPSMTRTITSFRKIGAAYRRDVEVHRLALIDPIALRHALSSVGFTVETIPRYGTTPLPAGVEAFVCRNVGSW